MKKMFVCFIVGLGLFVAGCSSTGTIVKAGPADSAFGGTNGTGDGHDSRGDAGHGPGGYGH